jgi:hypothetical protein
MNYAKVKDHPGLARDESTDQIVNTNIHEYQQYVTRREKRKAEKDKQLTVEEDLANLKGEISEIKSLLKELVNGK